MFFYRGNSSGEKQLAKYLLCVALSNVSTHLQDRGDVGLNSFEKRYEVSFSHCM